MEDRRHPYAIKTQSSFVPQGSTDLEQILNFLPFSGTKLKCPFCERTYGYETNLRAHIRQRHQGIRVPCPFCHRSFTRNNTVRRHIQREHRHQIKPNSIPAKFGSKQILPDQQFQEHMNLSSDHLNLTSQVRRDSVSCTDG